MLSVAHVLTYSMTEKQNIFNYRSHQHRKVYAFCLTSTLATLKQPTFNTFIVFSLVIIKIKLVLC